MSDPASATPARGQPAAYSLLSVIVPVYNERNTVVEILRRVRRVELPIDLEILVVDDGSTDGTDKLLATLEDSTVRVLTHRENRGKGAAVATALSHARGDAVLIQDADLEYDPEDYPALLAPLLKGKAKVVYGSRFTGERLNLFFWDAVGNRLLSLLTDVLYNTTLSDMETGYKLFDRRLLDALPLRAQRFDFEPEVTAKILRLGHRIYEVPISYAGRAHDEGKKITWRDGVVAAWTLVRCRFGNAPG